jgi:hypothetical protein
MAGILIEALAGVITSITTTTETPKAFSDGLA